MFRFDHHVHTTRYSPDSIIEPYELIEAAQAAGLAGVVITEHDAQWEEEELDELRADAGDLIVLSGAEVSAREGHFLVYGLPDLNEVPPGVRLAELLKVVERHQAAVVAAHPFRWGQDFRAIVAEHGPAFDALELLSNNVSRDTRALTSALLADHPGVMGATGSSDGHEPEIVGCYSTGFPRPIRTMAEFVAALQARLGTPLQRPSGGPLAAGPAQ